MLMYSFTFWCYSWAAIFIATCAVQCVIYLQANMLYWERAVKEQEDSLRELVSHRQRDK